MKETEVYSIPSASKESFEIKKNFCYAATEPKDMHFTDNVSYGQLSCS